MTDLWTAQPIDLNGVFCLLKKIALSANNNQDAVTKKNCNSYYLQT